MAHPQTSLEPADDPLDAQTWAANWIGLTGAPAGVQPNLWLCFRKTLRLENVPGRVQVRIAAESKYWLWVNGRLLVFEGGLKRGPAPDATWFDELDLADALRPGDNTFALLVWYFGKDGFSHNNSGKPGLLFEERFDRRVVLGDSGWRVIRHPAYCDTGEPHPNYRLPESNIRFDAGCDIPGWVCVGYDDSNWPKAVELGRPPCAPWGRLILRTIPQWRDAGPRHYRSIQIQHAPDGACVHRARLPYNAQVTPCLDIEAPAGLTIDIRTDQYIDGGEPTVRAEYVTRDGRQAYESLGWMHGQEVCYTLPAGIRVHGLTYRETGYDTDITGHFRCDDEALNTLWTKSARTLYLNMRDTFFDTPGRERAQWWGDVVIMLSQVFYGCDRRAHALVRKAIRDLVSWQRPDKVLFSPTPAGNYRDELPMQMLASVGYYGFWTYYLHTGDTGLIERVYPAVRSYLGLWGLGDDGLVVQRPGDWTWGDWGDNKDLPLLYNGWYALALHGQRAMAELIGREKDIAPIDQRLGSLHANFADRFWRGDCLRSEQHTGPPDDRSHALAVLAGLVDARHHDGVHTVLKQQMHASPYMEKYVLEAMYRLGHADDALARMKRRYKHMISSPISTLWEGWELGTAKYGGGTCNHAWSGGPMILLSAFSAGVTPTSPGYEHFQVRPQPGPMREFSVCVPSVRGVINTTFTRHDDRDVITLSVPPGCRCDLFPPTGRRGAVSVWSAGRPVRESVAADVAVTLEPGDHRFEFRDA